MEIIMCIIMMMVLSDTDDIHQVKEVVDNILNLYRSDDSIKLISIS